jgi:dephospho-CoA kinase
MILKVGLTGGIASGKTQISNVLKSFGVAVIDADVIAREVVAYGSPALTQIADHFGEAVLDDQGFLRRDQLRHIVFTEPAAKAWLEALLHPLIGNRIKQQLQVAQGSYVLLVSPLLLETEQKHWVDQIVVVDAQPQQQCRRVTQRDGDSEAQIAAIMASQMSRQQRLQQAHIVVDNTGDWQALSQGIKQLHQQLSQLSES